MNASCAELNVLLRTETRQRRMHRLRCRYLRGAYRDHDALLYAMLSCGVHRFSFLPPARQSFDRAVEEDVMFVLKVAPELAQPDHGLVRHVSKITPFSVACMNDKVPDNVVHAVLACSPHEHYQYTRDQPKFSSAWLCTSDHRRVRVQALIDDWHASRN